MARLKTTLITTSKYKGKSKFPFFQDIKEGDCLYLFLHVNSIGRNRGSLYATDIRWENRTNGSTFRASLTETANYLTKIEYIER